MPEPSSSDAFGSRMLRYVRLLVTGRAQEPSLRDQIEEAIDVAADAGEDFAGVGAGGLDEEGDAGDHWD